MHTWPIHEMEIEHETSVLKTPIEFTMPGKGSNAEGKSRQRFHFTKVLEVIQVLIISGNGSVRFLKNS